MKDTDTKIVLALSRIAHAFQVLLRNETKASALSPIQIQILVFLFSHPESEHTITSLAQEFDLSKPTISDSVKSLLEKSLIKKIDNHEDSRSYRIALTDNGREMALNTSDLLSPLQNPLSTLPDEQKKVMLDGLVNLIYALHQTETIAVQRMCYTCNHYEKNDNGHYCKLLQSTLENHELQLDCNEHVVIIQ